MAAGDDKLPFDLSDPIIFLDLIVEHLRLMAAGTGRSSKQPTAAVPLQKPKKKKKAKSSTESVEINNVEVEKDKDEEEREKDEEDELSKAKDAVAAAAEEPENVPETNDHLLVSEDAAAAAATAAAQEPEPEPEPGEKYLAYRTGPLKLVFRKLSTSEAENRRMIRESKRKLEYDDINIHKPKKRKVRSCIHVACESSRSPPEGAESTASAPSPVHRAAFNPIVASTDNNISSAAAVNCASTPSAAKQAPPALPFDLNLPPPDEF